LSPEHCGERRRDGCRLELRSILLGHSFNRSEISDDPDRNGGQRTDRRIPELTAVLVVPTGVLGALCAPEIALLFGVCSWRARGLAAGVAGHGIATSRMLSLNETAGAFAGLAMGLCGLLTAVLLPFVFHALSLDAASP
jgi:hypothetical protein